MYQQTLIQGHKHILEHFLSSKKISPIYIHKKVIHLLLFPFKGYVVLSSKRVDTKINGTHTDQKQIVEQERNELMNTKFLFYLFESKTIIFIQL